MASIITREVFGTGATAKGSPLTNAEIDQNFISLNTELANLPIPSGLTAGSSSSGFLQYSGTTATPGQLNGGTTAPTDTTRLNYEGEFYATRFVGDGSLLTDIFIPNGKTAGSEESGPFQYSGTGAIPGQLNGGTTTPTATIRLNYEGYLYATRFYGDGSQLTNIPTPSGLTSGSSSSGFLQYSGTTATSGQLNGGTTAPTNTTRLNYEGNFYATNFFGSGVLSGVKEVRVAITTDINLNSANYFTKTISGATTLTVSNTPATGTVASFILDLTNGGSSTITWWSNIRWVSGIAPTLTASGRDVLGFFTHNNGSDWTGLVLGSDVK